MARSVGQSSLAAHLATSLREVHLSLCPECEFYGAVLFQIDNCPRLRWSSLVSLPSLPLPPSHSQCAARSPSRRRAPAALLRGSRGAAALNRLDLGGGNLFGGRGPPRTDRLARASLLRGTLGQARLVDDVLERGLEPTRSRAVDVLRGCPDGRTNDEKQAMRARPHTEEQRELAMGAPQSCRPRSRLPAPGFPG